MSLQVRGKLVRILPLFLLLCLLSLPAWAGHDHAREGKPAILLVAFGTSVPEAAGVYASLESQVRAAFPDMEVRWAYTSHIIRRKLAGLGQAVESPAAALLRLAEDGFTRVAVQSLHHIAGEEFHDLMHTARALQGMPDGPHVVRVGLPLLASAEDARRVAEALLASAPKARRKGEALVYMGHGTPHPADLTYPAMQHILAQADPLAVLGTVEGWPGLDEVVATLKKNKVKRAYLLPLMAVAGDHARNDMAGDDPDSWKSVLTKAGIEAVPVLQGLAGNPAVAAVWVDHLRTVMEKL